MMNVIYNSEHYYVVEYPAQHGYELVDKKTQRGTFLQGDVADRFAQSMQNAVNEDASIEHVDEFLGSFDVLMNLRLIVH
jgi:hypothetical protein